MIEIALDENDNDLFLNQPRPVFWIKEFTKKDLKSYREQARELITQYSQENIVIVRHQQADFSVNKFALALFIESCLLENKIDCAVLKVANANLATQLYKPYVALCVALKFAMRLSQEDPKEAYAEIFDTGYLGFYIRKDYLMETATFFLKKGKKVLKIEGQTFTDALVIIGIMKAFSLAQLDYTIHAEFKFNGKEKISDLDSLITRICNYVLPYLPD